MLEICSKEYIQQFQQNALEQRVPLSGSIELTRRCNLKCVHCYLGNAYEGTKDKELTVDQWCHILDDVTQAGCLSLLITGGEPLLRSDFYEIYTYAKNKGLIITLFTNGTLLSNQHIELFKDLPPYSVEISLYGSTEATYERITGSHHSFHRCMEGIENLLKHQIHLSLKTVLMTLNLQEFDNIKRIAEHYGVKFRFDAEIFPCFNGNKAPIHLRVSPEKVLEKELSDHIVLDNWIERYHKTIQFSNSDRLYGCGAGRIGFNIDPFGNMSPCLMTSQLSYSLVSGSFITGWNTVVSQITEKKTTSEYPCQQCQLKGLCSYCPAFFKIENGSEFIPSTYVCALSQQRYQKISNEQSQ